MPIGKGTIIRQGIFLKIECVVCACKVVGRGLFLLPLQQPPSIFITSHGDGEGGEGKKGAGGAMRNPSVS